MNSLTDVLSLSKEFDNQIEEFNDINNSTLSSSSDELQDKISKLIRGLEETTLRVSELAIFSDNEEYEELSTESLKMLLLPALLGFLSLKSIETQRLHVLKVASIYFRDFIQRCNDYGLTTAKVPGNEADSDEEGPLPNPRVKGIDQMNIDRMQKIERYKQKKILKQKLDDLKVNKSSSDEESVRNYYLTLIEFNIFEVLDEFSSLHMEKDMLKRVNTMKNNGENLLQSKATGELKRFKPFLITKNEVQKKIYGAGYPSLPTYTVEEFYEQRVKDGIFPANSSGSHGATAAENSPEAEAVARELADENDDVTNLESLRSRDEWRDTHRRGYGNTYNRS